MVLHSIWTTAVIFGQANSEPPTPRYIVYVATIVNDQFFISCGGSIISPRIVLTSARCLTHPHETFIFAGSSSFLLKLPIDQSVASEGQIRKMSKMITHEKFKLDPNEYDVALVSFEDELIFGDTVSSAKLPWYWARLDYYVQMFAWQRLAPENQTMVLRLTETRLACRSKIKDMAEPGAWDNLGIYTDGVLFVKDHIMKTPMCYGGTGSPVVQIGILIGIASFGIDYNCKGLNAIISIRRYMYWIIANKELLEGKNVTRSRDVMLRGSNGRRIEEVSLGINKTLRSKWRSAASPIKPRIRNGTRIVSPDTHPFLVAIARYVSADPKTFLLPLCTGSILTQWTILTAAHCCNTFKMIVYAGVIDLKDLLKPGNLYQAITVADLRSYPKYNGSTGSGDIGLLLLSSPLKFSFSVAPVCQLSEIHPSAGTSFYIAGWGYVENRKPAYYPSWAEVKVMVPPRGFDAPGLFFIITRKGPAPCDGDSGGPYFNAEHELAGVGAITLTPKQNKSRAIDRECDAIAAAANSAAWFSQFIFDTMVELEKNTH